MHAHLLAAALPGPGASRSRQLATQQRRLRALLQSAADVPHYRGLPLADIRTAEDLPRLPVLDKATLRARLPDLLRVGAHADALRYERTNGTTGEPLRFPATAAELRFKHALWFAGYQRCGLRPWHRQAKFMIAGSIPTKRWAFQRLGLFRRNYASVSAPTAEKIAWLRACQPDALFAWGSVLTEIALKLADLGDHLDIPVIISSSDALQREHVEPRLRGRLSDLYGAMETGPLGWPCPTHGGYHVDDRWVVVELLDDADRPASHGRVVCTVLWRRTVPLLRYDLGDLATWAREPCSCGSLQPRLAHLDGRQPDLLVLANGERFTASVVAATLRSVAGIRQFQLVQLSRTEALLRIVPGPEYDGAATANVEERLRQQFGGVLAVRARLVDHVHRPREEKLSSVVTLERLERMRARGVDVTPFFE